MVLQASPVPLDFWIKYLLAINRSGRGLEIGENFTNSTNMEIKVPCWNYWINVNT